MTQDRPTHVREAKQDDHRGGPAGWVLIAATAVVLILVLRPWRGLGGASGHDPSQAVLDWRHDYAAGLAEAGQLQRPALLLFTADWCPPCRELKSGPLIDPAVARTITDKFVPIKIDLTKETPQAARVADRYRINGIPALIVVDADGHERARGEGSVDAPALQRWLKKLSDAPADG